MIKKVLSLVALLAMACMAMAQSSIPLTRLDNGNWTFKMPAHNLSMSSEIYSTNDPNGYTIDGIPDGWQIQALGETVTITDGVTTPLTTGITITIVPPDDIKDRIKSLKLSYVGVPEDRVMRFTTNLIDDDAAQTRAGFTTNTLNQEGMKIMVKVVNPNNAAYSYFTTLTYNGTEWVPATEMLWENSTQSVQVTALSLGGSYILSQSEFESGVIGWLYVDNDQSTQAMLNAQDVLCMVTKTVNPQSDLVGGKIAIDFYHAMTKLDVKLELMDEFFTAGQNTTNISDVKIINIGQPFDIKPMEIVNEKYCYLQARSGERPDVLPMKGDCTDATADSKHSFATYECIVPPQTVAEGQLTVSFKIGDRSFSWTNTEAITLEQGKHYTLPLTVGNDGVTAGGQAQE